MWDKTHERGMLSASDSVGLDRKKGRKTPFERNPGRESYLGFLARRPKRMKKEHPKKKPHFRETTSCWKTRYEKGGYNEDQCLKHKCGPGKQCESMTMKSSVCCVPKCAEEDDSRRKLYIATAAGSSLVKIIEGCAAANHNETGPGDCELLPTGDALHGGADEWQGQHKYTHVTHRYLALA
ncbi:hypothetical protein HNY73_011742, partial [Argiope bruennichi]